MTESADPFDAPTSAAWDPLLERALAGDGANAVYQPIVDVHRMTVAGYESLGRFTGPAGLTTDRWFAAAHARGLAAALDAVALRAALRNRRTLPANCFLTVNLEPASLLSDTVGDVMDSAGDLRGLVVEITEHRPVTDRAATERVLARWRNAGCLFALDDAGAGYAGLQQILELRPAFLKLDRTLVDGIDRDEAKAALVEMLGVFANKVDAWLLAEGVETEAEAHRIVALGVPLAQGYFFARPAPPWTTLDTGRISRLHAQLDDARRGTLRAIVDPMPAVKEVAHRVATRRPADTTTPVLVTDDAGRYVGAVTITRLLAALAGD